MINAAHKARIKQELQTVGVSKYGLLKSEARHLYQFIHEDEHIGGAVYGQIGEGQSAFLVATDRRVIFFDYKPFYSTFDELTYDVVAGLKLNQTRPFASVTLHTRVTDYTLLFVNAKCAHIFAEYVEKRRLKSTETTSVENPTPPKAQTSIASPNQAGLKFLREHDLGVLSTIDRTGGIHGAVVYYVVDQNDFVYILTKSGTGKGRNIYHHNQVALTIHEPGTMQTLQLEGNAEVETNQTVKDDVFSRIVKPRSYRDKTSLPPVTKLHEGGFMIIRISPTLLNYHNYAEVD